MIYPATLILATLVFNAASVLGAPVRIPSASAPAARALADEPVLPRKIEIVDVPARMRSLDDEPMDARSAPEIDTRDTASSDGIETRDPLPEVEKIVRRYPRRVYYDFYQKRSQPSAPPEKRAPEPDTPQVERRFPRRALYERHNAPPVEARAEPAEPPQIQRRYPRKVYAEYYEKRSTPPSPQEPPVAREPTPEPHEAPPRRFPREVYMKHYERRQSDDAKHYARQETPEAPQPVITDAAATPAAESPVPTPSQPSGATASGTAAVVPPQASPIITHLNSSTPLDVNALFHNITSNDSGFQRGTTIQETTVLVHKVTHISEPEQKKVDDAPVVPPSPPTDSTSTAPSASAPVPSASPSTAGDPVAPPSESPVVAGGEQALPQPSASDAATRPTSTESPATPSPTSATTEGENGGEAKPDESASNSGESKPEESASGEATPPATDSGSADTPTDASEGEQAASRRSLGSDASPEPILRRRNLGYSGPAWASYTKRSVTN